MPLWASCAGSPSVRMSRTIAEIFGVASALGGIRMARLPDARIGPKVIDLA